jgi:hypothetical protein
MSKNNSSLPQEYVTLALLSVGICYTWILSARICYISRFVREYVTFHLSARICYISFVRKNMLHFICPQEYVTFHFCPQEYVTFHLSARICYISFLSARICYIIFERTEVFVKIVKKIIILKSKRNIFFSIIDILCNCFNTELLTYPSVRIQKYNPSEPWY